MLENLSYRNHLNEAINFGQAGIYVSGSDIHNYNWDVVSKNDKISSFRRKVTTKKLPVTIFCKTQEEGIAARNFLLEVAEKDVLAKKPGKLIVGEYYYTCYITGSEKSRYLTTKRLMEAKLTITTDRPVWVRETTSIFRKADTAVLEGLDYSYDYPLDFSNLLASTSFNNRDITASNFRMIVYGPCSSPEVYVSGHLYGVDCEVASGEYITIDSSAKTITKTSVIGQTANIFDLRRRSSYIFEKIPAGQNVVSWQGDFGVDITLLEERSEPKWT